MIPENEFMKEAQHIKGFEDEVYWVTQGGHLSSGCRCTSAHQRDCHIPCSSYGSGPMQICPSGYTRSSTPSAMRPSTPAPSSA